MEESECLVCFARFDDEKHRPRFMPCGHTMCSVCLERTIREVSKMCPKCRKVYSASNVEELPVNFSLESMVKSTNTSKFSKVENSSECLDHQYPVNRKSLEPSKVDSLPECVEHQLKVTKRCSTHKSWVCQSCICEDHSSTLCKIITIREELNNKISINLEKSQPFVDTYEETCEKSDDCKQKYKNIINDCDEEIIRYEMMVKKLQEEIQRKKNVRKQLQEKFTIFDEKVDNLIAKRNQYDLAVTYLKSSKTIREMSRCSDEVQYETKKLQGNTQLIENEIDLMLQTFKATPESSIGLSLGNPKLSERDGKIHLHVLQEKNTSDWPLYLQFPDQNASSTDGIVTFLDISLQDQEPQRVYMKMLGNTVRARQHILLSTGQCGYSYKDLHFYNPVNVGEPGEFIIICAYDGENATPLFKNTEVTDVVDHNIRAGLMTGALIRSTSNNGLFGVYLTSYPGKTTKTGFGVVTSGLEVLKEVAKSKERKDFKVVDCGVVLY